MKADSEGRLSTTLYCKPNDSHSYLHYESAHPIMVKKGLPYSEFLRVKRICSNSQDFDQNCAMLGAHFIRRGYPLQVLDEAYAKVKNMSRIALLTEPDPDFDAGTGTHNVDNSTTSDTERPKVFSITTFNPAGNPNQQLIKGNWNLLGKSNTTFHLYRHQVVHGYRRPTNLRDMLVHSRLKITRSTNPGQSGKLDSHKECKD